MMVFAAPEDNIDAFTNTFAEDVDAYVDWLLDYAFEFEPEFLSPLNGVMQD